MVVIDPLPLHLFKHESIMKFRIISRHLLAVATLAIFLHSAVEVSAQSAAEETPSTPNIVEIIEQNSEGDITIDIPADLMKLVNPVRKQDVKDEPAASSHRQRTAVSGPRQTSGYRIQIFSDGRNQRTLQSRARARSNSVIARFPKYRNQVYSFSKAPNWYTRIGNFKTQQEASAALSELRRAFPGFAGEMRVVKSNIIVVE